MLPKSSAISDANSVIYPTPKIFSTVDKKSKLMLDKFAISNKNATISLSCSTQSKKISTPPHTLTSVEISALYGFTVEDTKIQISAITTIFKIIINTNQIKFLW